MADCIFCQIAQKQIPTKVVYEDELFIAFPDIDPVVKVHILIIPKQHRQFNEVATNYPEIPGQVAAIAKKIAEDLEIDESGYRLTVNNGPDSGQEVQHLHWHLLGGERLGQIA
ncbi:histidine triad nucleotide-binding protein [Patescibacteria group bacterium]|nr:histidine triad nucleotide-binding protein [Patescibacteria group bacterium]